MKSTRLDEETINTTNAEMAGVLNIEKTELERWKEAQLRANLVDWNATKSLIDRSALSFRLIPPEANISGERITGTQALEFFTGCHVYQIGGRLHCCDQYVYMVSDALLARKVPFVRGDVSLVELDRRLDAVRAAYVQILSDAAMRHRASMLIFDMLVLKYSDSMGFGLDNTILLPSSVKEFLENRKSAEVLLGAACKLQLGAFNIGDLNEHLSGELYSDACGCLVYQHSQSGTSYTFHAFYCVGTDARQFASIFCEHTVAEFAWVIWGLVRNMCDMQFAWQENITRIASRMERTRTYYVSVHGNYVREASLTPGFFEALAKTLFRNNALQNPSVGKYMHTLLAQARCSVQFSKLENGSGFDVVVTTEPAQETREPVDVSTLIRNSNRSQAALRRQQTMPARPGRLVDNNSASRRSAVAFQRDDSDGDGRVRGFGGREESFSSEPSFNADPWGDDEGDFEDSWDSRSSHNEGMEYASPSPGADPAERRRLLFQHANGDATPSGGDMTPRAAGLDQLGQGSDDGFFNSDDTSRENSGLGPAARGPPGRLGNGGGTPRRWDDQHDSDAASRDSSGDLGPASWPGLPTGNAFSSESDEERGEFGEIIRGRGVQSKFPALQLLRAVDRTIGLIKKT